METHDKSEAKCPCCGHPAKLSLRVTWLPKYIFGVDAAINKCAVCGCGITFPQPASGYSYYTSNNNYDDIFREKMHLYSMFATDLLGNLKHVIEDCHGKKLLDVACGGGFMVEAASRMGFVAKGIEANESIAKWCQLRGLT
jgi:hypothetical protein